jgi:PBP1b-binding outer membrane lipoprotein LpoB
MKNLIVIITSILLLTSCATQKTIELANGKKVTEKQFQKMTHKAFEESFGKMSSQEDSLLFNDVKVTVDTINTIVPDTLSGN